MTETTNQKPSRLYIISLISLGLAIVFDYLFFRKFMGISVGIFTAGIVGCGALLSLKSETPLRKASWLMVLALFFAGMVAVRSNDFLSVLNMLAALFLLLLAARILAGRSILSFTIKNYVNTVLVVPFQMLERSFQSLAALFKPATVNRREKWKPVVKGVIMALPFLILFIVLFAGADMAFKNFLTTVFSFNLSIDLLWQALIVICLLIACLGYFAFIFIPAPKPSPTAILPDASAEETAAADRRVETKVFLWLIAALFLVFICFQVAYLFGGAINIIGESGVTYAEYARRGFWELLAVTIVTLLILFAMDFYTRKSERRLSWFTIPSLILTGEIFIIIVSALKRMLLYQSAYGWTTLRLYVAGFIIFLAVVFIILAVKLLWEKKNSFFAFAALLAMIAYLVAFNAINPDRFIARQNIQRFNESGKIDAEYLGGMSADATAEVLSVFDRLSNADKGTLQKRLYERKLYLERQTAHWQSYNSARLESLRLLSDFFAKKQFLNKEWKFPVMKEVATALKGYDGVSFFSPDSDTLVWKQDVYRLKVPQAETVDMVYCALDARDIYGTQELYNASPLRKINTQINDVMLRNGYAPDAGNTNEMNGYSDFNQGYQKGAVVCSLVLLNRTGNCGNFNSEITMSVKCATETQKALAEQKPLLEALDLDGTGNVAYPVKKIGNLLLVKSDYGFTNTSYVLRFDKGKYETVAETDGDGWSCDKMNELRIPKELYGECHNAAGEVVK